MPHSLGRALSALNNVLPGQAYAAYLVPTVQWTLPAGEEKLALVARVFDNTPSSLLLVGRPAEALPALLEDLQGDIGLPR